MKSELVTRLSALGMTKADLARSLGVSLSSIYHWTTKVGPDGVVRSGLPKYVEAYLASREREHGLAVPVLSSGVGSVCESVCMPSGGSTEPDPGSIGGGSNNSAAGKPDRTGSGIKPEGYKPDGLSSGRRRG